MSLYSPYEKKEKNQQVQQNSQNKDNNSSAPSSIKHQEQNNVHQLQPSNFTYQTYTPSETVQQAQNLLQQQMEQKPGQYQSTWKGQLNDTINQILNRNKFSYDVNGDALYQQYKDQYVQQGKLAMMDTMGQAAALTGGYGNTYGQSVGQQAYQAYLQKLNDVVPELYGMALDQYNQEGQALYDRAALMAQQEDQDYARYMDGLNAWINERNYLAGRYDTERDYDYGKWEGDRDFSYEQFLNDRNMGYQQERDRIADERYQQELAYQQEQDRIADERYLQELAYQQEQDRIAQEQWQAQFDEGVRQYEQERADARAAAAARSSGSGSGTKTDTGKTTISYKDQQSYKKDADKAVAERGIDGLYDIGVQMEFEGYSQETIENWIESEINRLFPDKEPEEPIKEPKQGSTGGGGGGRTYSALK